MAESLRDEIRKAHEHKVETLSREATALSTQLTAIAMMLESYFNAYTSNQFETEKLIRDFMLKKAKEPGNPERLNPAFIIRHFENQTNKIKNINKGFDKFTGKLLKESTRLYGNSDIKEDLLDVFDAFWRRHVKTDSKFITIKYKSKTKKK